MEGELRGTARPNQAAQVASTFPNLASKAWPPRLVHFEAAAAAPAGADKPRRVGISLSGGQAAGGCRPGPRLPCSCIHSAFPIARQCFVHMLLCLLSTGPASSL